MKESMIRVLKVAPGEKPEIVTLASRCAFRVCFERLDRRFW